MEGNDNTFFRDLEQYEIFVTQEKFPDALVSLDKAIESCPSSLIRTNFLYPLRKEVKTRVKQSKNLFMQLLKIG